MIGSMRRIFDAMKRPPRRSIAPVALLAVMMTMALLPRPEASALAAQLLGADGPRVSARLNKREAIVGQGVQLMVSIEGAGADVSQPRMPAIPGAELRYITQQSYSQTTIINGRRSESRSLNFIYELVPTVEGEIVVPVIEVEIDGVTYKTSPVTLRAAPPSERDDIIVTLELGDATPYVGEPFELIVTIYLQQSIRLRQFDIPGLESAFEIEDAAPSDDPRASELIGLRVLGKDTVAVKGRETYGDEMFDTVRFRKYLIPKSAGPRTIGPARFACDIILRRGRSLFDQDVVEPVVVPSNAVVVDVQPLPEAGRPADFTGLVGEYQLRTSAQPTDVNVGDPITLRIEVESDSPVSIDPAFDLARSGSPLSNGFRVSRENADSVIQDGARVYRCVIRPTNESVGEIPSIELPYFNPATRQYERAASAPIPLNVRSTRIVTADDALMEGGGAAPGAGDEIEDLTGGIAHNDESPEALHDQSFSLASSLREPAWLATVAAPPAIYLVAVMAQALRRRQSSMSSETRRARRRRSARARAAAQLQDAGSQVDGRPDGAQARLDAIANAMNTYIGERFDRPVDGLTTGDCVAAVARVSATLADELSALMGQVDAARYGGLSSADVERLTGDARSLIERIDRVTARQSEVAA